MEGAPKWPSLAQSSYPLASLEVAPLPITFSGGSRPIRKPRGASETDKIDEEIGPNIRTTLAERQPNTPPCLPTCSTKPALQHGPKGASPQLQILALIKLVLPSGRGQGPVQLDRRDMSNNCGNMSPLGNCVLGVGQSLAMGGECGPSCVGGAAGEGEGEGEGEGN